MKSCAGVLHSAVASIVATCSIAAGAEVRPIELLDNGGFEQGPPGIGKKGWHVNNAGKLSLVPGAHTGKLATRFEAVEHGWGFCAFAHGVSPVSPKAIYHLSLWAKGSGTISLACYQYSPANFIGTKFHDARLRLHPDNWQQLKVVYKPTDKRIRRAAMAIHLDGKGAVAVVDDVSFTFNPEENPGISIEPDRPATRTLTLHVNATDARVSASADGRSVAIAAGKGSITINEGLLALGIQAHATGPNPGVAATVVGQSETDGRWRVSTAPVKGWTAVGFDDGKWPVVKPGPDGRLWSTDKGAKSICLRQVILWNQTHHGPNRCIIPPIKVWEFPRGGFDVVHLALYSPLAGRLTDYEFILDMPEAFTLLDKQDYWERYITNAKPTAVRVETVKRDGMAYRRYRLKYKSSHLLPDRTSYSLLPITLAGDTKLKTCRWYIRRQACGNLTELQQTVPVAILPPVNGRMPKKVMISQYAPLGYSPVSKAHLHHRIKQDVAAGCNFYMMPWSVAWGEQWRAYLKQVHDTAAAAGARLIVWLNFPLNYGGLYQGHMIYYEDWIRSHPEAHGRYYQGKPAWGETKYRCPYCNQYVLDKEGEEFWAVVTKEYQRAVAFYPKAEMVFSDWEFHNITKDGSGVHCFCDRCKQAFRAFAKLPASADLADETIMKKHQKAWLAFRDRQDGDIIGRMANVTRKLGLKYITYSWSSNMTWWKACRGKIDAAFAGMPGNSVADSYFQNSLDDYATTFAKEVGLKQITGQRFVFFRSVDRDGWKATVLSDDGFVHPKTWKTQVLRVVAALHGGVDLQNSTEFCGGIRYYLGEATRLIAEFEPLFWDGERCDELAASKQIAYPNLLVLRLKDERLVLLFNEDTKPLEVVLENKGLPAGATGSVYGTTHKAEKPQRMALCVPPEDVAVVHIRESK